MSKLASHLRYVPSLKLLVYSGFYQHIIGYEIDPFYEQYIKKFQILVAQQNQFIQRFDIIEKSFLAIILLSDNAVKIYDICTQKLQQSLQIESKNQAYLILSLDTENFCVLTKRLHFFSQEHLNKDDKIDTQQIFLKDMYYDILKQKLYISTNNQVYMIDVSSWEYYLIYNQINSNVSGKLQSYIFQQVTSGLLGIFENGSINPIIQKFNDNVLFQEQNFHIENNQNPDEQTSIKIQEHIIKTFLDDENQILLILTSYSLQAYQVINKKIQNQPEFKTEFMELRKLDLDGSTYEFSNMKLHKHSNTIFLILNNQFISQIDYFDFYLYNVFHIEKNQLYVDNGLPLQSETNSEQGPNLIIKSFDLVEVCNCLILLDFENILWFLTFNESGQNETYQVKYLINMQKEGVLTMIQVEEQKILSNEISLLKQKINNYNIRQQSTLQFFQDFGKQSQQDRRLSMKLTSEEDFNRSFKKFSRAQIVFRRMVSRIMLQNKAAQFKFRLQFLDCNKTKPITSSSVTRSTSEFIQLQSTFIYNQSSKTQYILKAISESGNITLINLNKILEKIGPRRELTKKYGNPYKNINLNIIASEIEQKKISIDRYKTIFIDDPNILQQVSLQLEAEQIACSKIINYANNILLIILLQGAGNLIYIIDYQKITKILQNNPNQAEFQMSMEYMRQEKVGILMGEIQLPDLIKQDFRFDKVAVLQRIKKMQCTKQLVLYLKQRYLQFSGNKLKPIKDLAQVIRNIKRKLKVVKAMTGTYDVNLSQQNPKLFKQFQNTQAKISKQTKGQTKNNLTVGTNEDENTDQLENCDQNNTDDNGEEDDNNNNEEDNYLGAYNIKKLDKIIQQDGIFYNKLVDNEVYLVQDTKQSQTEKLVDVNQKALILAKLKQNQKDAQQSLQMSLEKNQQSKVPISKYQKKLDQQVNKYTKSYKRLQKIVEEGKSLQQNPEEAKTSLLEGKYLDLSLDHKVLPLKSQISQNQTMKVVKFRIGKRSQSPSQSSLQPLQSPQEKDLVSKLMDIDEQFEKNDPTNANNIDTICEHLESDRLNSPHIETSFERRNTLLHQYAPIKITSAKFQTNNSPNFKIRSSRKEHSLPKDHTKQLEILSRFRSTSKSPLKTVQSINVYSLIRELNGKTRQSKIKFVKFQNFAHTTQTK